MSFLDRETWQEIFATLQRHKLRTALTSFGVFWGIFMLVTMMGAGKGLQNGVESQFIAIKNAVFVWSGRPTSIPYKGLGNGRRIHFSTDDLQWLQEKVPGIDGIGATVWLGSPLTTFEGQGQAYSLQGVHPQTLAVKGFNIDAGRLMNELDIERQRKVVLIGNEVAAQLFPHHIKPVGQTLLIRGMPFLVVGVISPNAQNDWARSDASRIFVPHSTALRAFNLGKQVHAMVILPSAAHSAYDVQDDVKRELYERHRVHPDDPGVLGFSNIQERFDQMQGFFTGITLFIWTVAIGTIIAGVVGVGNIMLIAVKERTKEIGIRKALGATPAAITGMIVQEAMLITFVSGYAGLVAGVLLLESTASLMAYLGANGESFRNPEIDFGVALMAVIVLLAAGALAAWLPAKKAAAVNPVVALQDQ